MSLFHSKFRVDSVDSARAVKYLDAFCKKHNGKYLIALETAEQSGKLHLQGWVSHDTADNTYRQHFSRKYKEFDSHGKAFTPVPDQDLPPCIRYIVNNDNKEDLQFDSTNLFTNYTEDEFAEFKLLGRHLKREEFIKQLKKNKPKDWYQSLYDRVEQACIANNNRIDYSGARVLYLDDPPRYFNERRMHDTLLGIFTRLENKYPNNARARNRMLHAVSDLGNGLYDSTINYSGDT